MERLLYEEVKAKAVKHLDKYWDERYKEKGLVYTPIRHSSPEIKLWYTLNGYVQKRIMENGVTTIYYEK